jgi:mitochondrial fission protein ELM1
MILKITYPYKDSIATLQYKSIYIQTDDNNIIEEILATKNPIDIGVILSENSKKFKILKEAKEDKELILNEVIADPNLRLNLPEE